MKTIAEVARDMTFPRYKDVDIDFESCRIIDPNTGDDIKLRWFLELVEDDYKKMLAECKEA